MKHSSSAFVLLPVVATLLLLFASAMLSIQGALRLQLASRDAFFETQLGAHDLTLQKATISQVAADLVRMIQDLPISENPIANFENASGEWKTQTSFFGSLDTFLNIHSWEPPSTYYKQLQPTREALRLAGTGTQFIGREIQISYRRNSTHTDALRPHATQKTRSDFRECIIYEIPSQTAVSGRSILIGHHPVAGSVAARNLTLSPDALVQGGLTVWGRMRLGQGARFSQKTISKEVDALIGSEVVKRWEAGEFSSGSGISSNEVSLIRSNAWGAWLDLGDRRPSTEGISTLLFPSASPTLWDAYTRPYYQCETRLIAKLKDGHSKLEVSLFSASTDTLANRLQPSRHVQTFDLLKNADTIAGVAYRETTTGERLLVLDMATFGGRTVYVDFTASDGQRLADHLFVAFRNAEHLARPGGWSLVTPNRILLRGKINTSHPIPMSLLASEIRFGHSQHASRLTFQGQSVSMADGVTLQTDRYPDAGSGRASIQSLHLHDLSHPEQLPPIILKSWLIIAKNPETSS